MVQLETVPGAPVSDPAVLKRAQKRAGSEIGAPQYQSRWCSSVNSRPMNAPDYIAVPTIWL